MKVRLNYLKLLQNLFTQRKLAKIILGLLIVQFTVALNYANAEPNGKTNAIQLQKITGKVTDVTTGEALVGVTVIIQGTTTGTVTDINGKYTIEVSKPDAILVFSYMGYVAETVVTQGKTQVDMTLVPDIKNLEEIVVTGYGSQRKATLTGALGQVNSKVFESRATTNPTLALQGEASGLLVTRSSSRPGNEGINFQIRGATSVNGGSPLIVIDGAPIISSQDADGNTVTNSFYNMNPDDIESVTVLKDGMAAIYGSRAANGVILVTTKRGKGKLSVEYTGNVRFNSTGIKTPTASLQEYATLWINANKEESVPNWWGWTSQANMLKMQQGIEGIYPTQYWGDVFIGKGNRYDEMFQTRTSQQHNFSISGSSDKAKYRFSAGYADNQGNLATAYDGQKQYNIKLNTDFIVSDKIKFQAGLTFQNDLTSGPSGGLGQEMGAQDPPFFPAKNPYGQWNSNFGNAGNRNATAQTSDGGRNIRENNLTRVDLKSTIEVLKGLEVEGAANIQFNQYRLDLYNLTVPLYTWDGQLANDKLNSVPNIRAESDNKNYQNYSLLLRYTKEIGDHHITAMAGLTAERTDIKQLYAYRTLIPSYGVYDLNVAPTTYVEGSGGRNSDGLYSYLSRINYSYKDKYLFEVLGRRDGSSRFASGFKYINFYNVSGGWVLTNEDFFKKLNIKALNLLKFRASYGITGNQSGIALYDYLSQINQGTAVFGSAPAKETASWINNNGMISTTRHWERVHQANFGIDLSFLDDRLSGTVDYYKKQNEGMLISVVYPSVLGGTPPATNSGVLDVHGWEVTLGWKDKIGELSYNVSFNISDSRNKLSKMEGASVINEGKVATIVGRPLNSWYMYQTNGYFKDQADVDAYYAKYTANAQGIIPSVGATSGLRPGDIKKVDLNNDQVIDNKDVTYKGDAAAHYLFGLNLGASWKGIDFSAFFQGVGQQYIQRNGTMAYPFAAIWTNQNAAFIGKTWTETNTGAKFPRLTVDGTRAKWNYVNNDFMLQNNRYIRLKSLVVGYTIPKVLTQKYKIERIRIYFAGNDLWESTSIKDGYDPEQGEASLNNGYPFMRTWAFGLNIGF